MKRIFNPLQLLKISIVILAMSANVSAADMSEAEQIANEFLEAFDKASLDDDFVTISEYLHDDLVIQTKGTAMGQIQPRMDLSKQEYMAAQQQAIGMVSNFQQTRDQIEITQLNNGTIEIKNMTTANMSVQGMNIERVSDQVLILEVIDGKAIVVEWSQDYVVAL